MSSVKKFYAACKSGVAAGVTAWDCPTGLIAERAGMDFVLVGDSAGIVALGLESTVGITLDEIIYHCKAVSRAVKSPLLIGDMPLGTYEKSPEHGFLQYMLTGKAVDSSLRMIKEGFVDAIKLEGGKEMAPQVVAITRAGVPVIGHIGLTPQRALATLNQDLGDESNGRLSFGSTVASAHLVLEDALALQEAGAVAVLLEAVATDAAQAITKKLRIPTIGIGCGASTSAQIVLQSEVLGYLGSRLQRWHKPYASVGEQSVAALKKFKADTQSRQFPSQEKGYDMAEGEAEKLDNFTPYT